MSLIPFLGSIFIHAVPIGVTVNFTRYEQRRGRVGVSFRNDMTIVVLAISRMMAAHLVEMALWAVVFVVCGEFHDFSIAYYHSAVNYTTLGYGDVVMSPSWRLLGALEAADGVLMFGVSTALIFAVIQHLMQARFADLR